jgi:hypothetical protein
MRWISPLVVGWSLLCSGLTVHAVDPIPEPEQSPLALKILDAYHGARLTSSSKKLHVVYFTPSDRDPEPHYRERLSAIVEDIRTFYRAGMVQAGFGPKTFDLARDAEGKLIIHLVKGKESDATYERSGFQQNRESDASSRDRIQKACRPVLKAAGIDFDRETVLIFCNLAKWDEAARAFSHHSPYAGHANQIGGWCFAVDSVILNLDDLSKKEPRLKDAEWGNESLGKFNTIFIGGIAHELGHAFGLPHCGERWDEKARGKSLLGSGNHNYREELRGEGPGTFLTMASAMKLAARPLFSHSDKEMTKAPRLAENDFQLSTDVTRSELTNRSGALRLEGIVKGVPAIYGVIAYFDSSRTGGYDAPTATAVPDAEGRFAIEISDLAPSRQGELRIEYCHVNGAISERRAPFRVTPERSLDLAQWEVLQNLAPLAKAVRDEKLKTARTELRRIEAGKASELTKTIARKLAATLEDKPALAPANVPPEITQFPLGDARAKTVTVGWLKPTANRVPASEEIELPLLDAGKFYATGLYAHAPARHVFDLDRKWKTLRGEGGLHTLQQFAGSVVFVIKADGKEVFRSTTIRKSAKASYDVDVTEVKTLEFIVEDGGNGNGNDWGLWLDPTLSR